jgi:hypothetical protein
MSASGELRNSSPCLDCYNKMISLGIKNIVYSLNDDIIKTRLIHFKPQQYSLGRQYIMNGFKPIFRDKAEERQLYYDTDTSSVCSGSSSSSSSSSFKSAKKQKRKRKYKHYKY